MFFYRTRCTFLLCILVVSKGNVLRWSFCLCMYVVVSLFVLAGPQLKTLFLSTVRPPYGGGQCLSILGAVFVYGGTRRPHFAGVNLLYFCYSGRQWVILLLCCCFCWYHLYCSSLGHSHFGVSCVLCVWAFSKLDLTRDAGNLQVHDPAFFHAPSMHAGGFLLQQTMADCLRSKHAGYYLSDLPGVVGGGGPHSAIPGPGPICYALRFVRHLRPTSTAHVKRLFFRALRLYERQVSI